jgi:hypothetical protein
VSLQPFALAPAVGLLLLLPGLARAQPAPEAVGAVGRIDSSAAPAAEPEPEPPRSSAGFIQLAASGKGWSCYGQLERRWGKAALIYGIMRVAARWQGIGPDMGVGDISIAEGGPIWSIGRRGKKYLAHKTHRNGDSADVRPVRSDGQTGPVAVGARGYSRELTGRLIDLFREDEMDVVKILFNDRKIEWVRRSKGHHDHLHVSVQ